MSRSKLLFLRGTYTTHWVECQMLWVIFYKLPPKDFSGLPSLPYHLYSLLSFEFFPTSISLIFALLLISTASPAWTIAKCLPRSGQYAGETISHCADGYLKFKYFSVLTCVGSQFPACETPAFTDYYSVFTVSLDKLHGNEIGGL